MRFHRLDLNLLAGLEALLTHRSVSRAAEQLCLTQPAVSNALARLRQHFQDDLLLPVGRQMVPTPLANRLHGPLREFLRLAKDLALTRSAFEPRSSDACFRVVASDFIAAVLLGDVGRRLAREAPGITLHVLPITPPSIERFVAGDADLLICPEQLVPASGPSRLLFEDRFVVVACAIAHGATPPLTPGDYFAATHVLEEFGETGVRTVVDAFLAGRPPRRVRLRMPSFASVVDAVAGTPHLATVPESFARRRPVLPIRVLPVTFELPWISESMRWPRHLDADPGSRWLRDLMAEVAAGQLGAVRHAGS